MIEQTVSDPQRAILKSTQPINLFLAGVGCFDADTLIPTKQGYKKIKDIRSGEYVLSFNIEIQRQEYKEVVNKFCYKTGEIKQNCIKFVLLNGIKIICTNEHEFYFEGTWIRAGEFALRILEASYKNKQSLLYQQQREIIDTLSIRRLSSGDNETSNRWEWIFADCNIARRDERFSYNKNAQISCGSIHSKSRTEERNKSFEWDKNRQPSRESSMGNAFGKLHPRIRNGAGIKSRFTASKAYIERGISLLYSGIKEIGEIIQRNIGNNWIQEISDKRLLYSQLVAREISLSEIKSFEYINCDLVYDLEVKDNHNYCITTENIIVHNSGKTHLLGIKTYQLIRRFPKVRGFIAANTYLQLEHSTLFRIREYWKSIGIVEYEKDSRPQGQYVVSKKTPFAFQH